MRAVVQRVREAAVTVDGKKISSISSGLVVLLGVANDDGPSDVVYLAEKVAGLRIFPDAGGKMNLSVAEAAGEVLVVSQFTLYGDCRKGRRPGFEQAAAPELAQKLYLDFIEKIRQSGVPVTAGRFQSEMLVHIDNQGPVTILLDSKKIF